MDMREAFPSTVSYSEASLTSASFSKNTNSQTLLEEAYLPNPEKVQKEFSTQQRVKGLRAASHLSLIASVTLGVMTGLAIMGIMTTPAGWAIAGAALLIGLAGSLYCGGVDALLKTAGLSIVSFGAGVLAGSFAGIFAAGAVLI